MTLAQDKFGGLHTEKKLQVIEAYLKSFVTALKNQKQWRRIYIDAFAGSGDIPHSSNQEQLVLEAVLDINDFMEGSASRALRMHPPFDEYIFIEKSSKKIEALRRRASAEGITKRCRFIKGDASQELQKICKSYDWNNFRAVCFLDPYGNQVSFDTLKELANTEAIDVWYLFPAFWGIARQVSNDGNVHHTHEGSLNKVYGTESWKDIFINPTLTPDLFGERANNEKKVDQQMATEFMIERLRTIFNGCVLDRSLPLGRNGLHEFSLLFASGNPSSGAKKLCKKLATAVLK